MIKNSALWQIDKSCCNIDNEFCIKIDVLEVINNERLLIAHPIEKKRIRVKSETEKYIFLTSEMALKWLEITLRQYRFNTFFWQQTARKIEQIKTAQQATRAYIYLIYYSQNLVKKTHFDFHYTEVDCRRNALFVENFESKINQ